MSRLCHARCNFKISLVTPTYGTVVICGSHSILGQRDMRTVMGEVFDFGIGNLEITTKYLWEKDYSYNWYFVFYNNSKEMILSS